MKRVVITGIGAVTPLGNDIEATWENLKKGRSGIGLITRFDASGLSSRIAGELKGFSPEKYLSKKDILRLDPFIHYAIAAAVMALEDAGLIRRGSGVRGQGLEKQNHSSLASAGVVIGSSRGGISTFEKSIIRSQVGTTRFRESGVRKKFISSRLTPHILRFSPYLMPATAISMASSYISMRFGIKGPSLGISTACASGANAIGEALRLIQHGEINLSIAGGAEAPICRFAVGGYSAAGALSKRNNNPEKASRPFDRGRDGFVIAEGAGILVLEELNHALKRGANIYAEITGYGTSSDAFHMTKPDGRGEASAIKKALNDAKISIEDVDYINAHATSTALGDRAEIQAVKKVFGTHASGIPISACKSMLGHMLGGAGAVEAAITALSISRGIITPVINLENPDLDRNLNYVKKTQKKDLNTALSNSFGFGGVNAVLVLRKF
ncbi:MAG: beta-ketoacyl-ACP synthase II [Nitrospirae bacterium]|nr:beta-ketoacyl-ACP synthase II [Nitrospirota bacterium]